MDCGYVESNGHKLYYEDYEMHSEGEPLLLIMGWARTPQGGFFKYRLF